MGSQDIPRLIPYPKIRYKVERVFETLFGEWAKQFQQGHFHVESGVEAQQIQR